MVTINLPNNIGNAFFSNTDSTNLLTIETGAALQILKDYAVLNPDLGANQFGIHSYVNVSNENKVQWGRFRAAENVARERDVTCTWNPGGGVQFSTESLNVCSKQHQTETCVGELMDSCWEKLLAIGVDITNISASAEGATLLGIILQKEYETIGNDYYKMAYFANHPTITESDTQNYWMQGSAPDGDKWESFVTMLTQGDCGGIMTLAEYNKTVKGLNNFNVPIERTDVSGSEYTGDALALIRKVIRSQPPSMKIWSKTRTSPGMSTRPLISVTTGIYQKLLSEYTQMFNGIPQGYQLQTQGEYGWQLMPGTLLVDGYWVIERDDWSILDAMTGMTSHIVMMTAPGVLGIASDVSPMKQFKGMGLIMTQHNVPPFLGKTYFHTNYKLATAILDTDYVVYGSLFLEPEIVQ